MQKEISAVIEKNPTLNGEITQLQNSECDCENENYRIRWQFSSSMYPFIFYLVCFFYESTPIGRTIYVFNFQNILLFVCILVNIFCFCYYKYYFDITKLLFHLYNLRGKSNEKEMVGDWNHSLVRWCDHSTNYQLQHCESIR